MPKFRVLHTAHYEKGNTYLKGDVLDSVHDLMTDFPNKFERLPDEIPATNAVSGFVSNIAPGAPFPATLATPGETIAPKASAIDTNVSENTNPPTAPSDAPKAPTPRLGKNVTKDFPHAIEQDFTVLRHQGEHFVYNNDKPDAPIEGGAGISKVDVVAAIDAELARDK